MHKPLYTESKLLTIILKTKQRDGNVCVFTGTENPTAAHIIGASTSTRDLNDLDHFLEVFLDSDKAQNLKDLYRDPNVVKGPLNNISMVSHANALYDAGRIGLKPLHYEGNSLVVQFHWLRKSCLSPKSKIGNTGNYLAATGLSDTKGWGEPGMLRRVGGARIYTGQIFRITGSEECPAPSFELLWLDWMMRRMAAIAGAAGPQDDDPGWGEPGAGAAGPVLDELEEVGSDVSPPRGRTMERKGRGWQRHPQ